MGFINAVSLRMVIYFTIIGYSSTVANGVSEERESRIIEVLITSVEPHQIMISKLVGIGMVGLTQYALWGLLGAAIALPANLLLGRAGFRIPSIPASLLGYSVIFFLLGYFLFGTINLIVGAMASKPEDVTLISRPLGLINILPWFLYYLVMKDPNGMAAVTLSMIPFLAPTLMMVRIIVSATPVSHILLSIFIMLLSIAFVLWIASKVYRARILIYGKRVTLAELGRWLRYKG
jgi:ABC-2 type transport system permease protein